jgi:hypothetical protein
MMTLIKVYLIVSVIGLIDDEKRNLENPSIRSDREYLLCNWTKDDFYPIEVIGGYILKAECESDSKIKAKARKKYWETQYERHKQK